MNLQLDTVLSLCVNLTRCCWDSHCMRLVYQVVVRLIIVGLLVSSLSCMTTMDLVSLYLNLGFYRGLWRTAAKGGGKGLHGVGFRCSAIGHRPSAIGHQLGTGRVVRASVLLLRYWPSVRASPRRLIAALPEPHTKSTARSVCNG
jgi:hypothetical protein